MSESLIDDEIVDGACSYCGRNADYAEDSFGNLRFYGEGCEQYNNELENDFDDDPPFIIPVGDDNLNVYF